MSVIYILIPIAIILTAIGIYLFFWAVKTDQFDDLEKQGLSILFDDDTENTADKTNKAASEKASQSEKTPSTAEKVQTNNND
ncbi:cbb3-type cytochrome oxidase assembly protein CcoS [Thalassotalea sp. G2M2-11]|uniref:cbb3-type cytochrome oxidase assembly protein CcoS n=1 Tax=Thalassotalea sp. G2M2-11 TaxID=2787627 RepID=UPI0019CFD483|nr:cbb3-type cytochrome oxidase assembly protein CcoS [Thalassotalea sp. G2M2-11]